MKFSKLAEYYEKLEATSKRLELVDILSKLFGESDSAEIMEELRRKSEVQQA